MKVEWTRAQVDEIEHNAYTVGILTGERMERSRMEKILEAGEENRQADIQLGAKQERERIIALVKEVWEGRCSPVMEPDECSVCWLVDGIIKKIRGESE